MRIGDIQESANLSSPQPHFTMTREAVTAEHGATDDETRAFECDTTRVDEPRFRHIELTSYLRSNQS